VIHLQLPSQLQSITWQDVDWYKCHCQLLCSEYADKTFDICYFKVVAFTTKRNWAGLADIISYNIICWYNFNINWHSIRRRRNAELPPGVIVQQTEVRGGSTDVPDFLLTSHFAQVCPQLHSARTHIHTLQQQQLTNNTQAMLQW